MIRRLIYELGVKVFNNEVKNSIKFLKEMEFKTRDELEDYQFIKCKLLLRRAYKHSEYYKEVMDKAGVTPDDFKELSDLSKFPILSKEDLRKNVEDMQIYHGINQTKKAQTSGTSGQSLVFQRDLEWDARNRAAIYRGYSWYGVKPHQRNGYFWGYNLDKTKKIKVQILDELQNRFRIFEYSGEGFESFIKKLKKADYLEGYSSAIYQTAKIINEMGMSGQFNQIKMVKGTSEKIFDKYQEEVEKAFGIKMVSEYGATESGIIAFECPEGNMHITSENVIVEEVDGEILVTNLVSNSLPIIRYKLGDYVEIDSETKCKCGRNHPIVKNVLGRVGCSIYGKVNIYPSLYIYYVFKNIAAKGIVLNFQCIQSEKGKMLVNIENSLNKEERIAIEEEFKKYFKDDIELDIKENAILERNGGKLKDFISKVK